MPISRHPMASSLRASDTGKVVSADPFVPSINWATGFDEKNNWAPILNPDSNYGKTGKGFYVWKDGRAQRAKGGEAMLGGAATGSAPRTSE